MKTSKLIVPIVTGVLFAAAANAQENITITGSTAARRIVYDRAATLFDAGFTTHGGALAYNNSANSVTAQGTMSNAIPALGSTVVTMRFSMSGSVQGIVDLDQANSLTTLDPATGASTNSGAADIAFSDNYLGASPVTIPPADLTSDNQLMVLPFLFFKNPTSPDMASVTGITREQAYMLMTSSGLISGFNGMPASFLGSTSPTAAADPVYLLGRDIGSGTRVGVTHDIGFTTTPIDWTTNGANPPVLVKAITEAGGPSSGIVALDVTGNTADGFSSGGTLCKVAAGVTGFNIIGYSGEPDAAGGNGIQPANWIQFEGATCNHSNVANGYYPVWCYEHVFARSGSGNTGLDANQSAIFLALQTALTNSAYQTGNPVFYTNAVPLAQMKVKRGLDGGTFTTTPTAGF